MIFTCNWALNNRPYTLTPPMLCNYRLDSLTELHLCFVEVTGEALEYILFACPLLESLYVTMSHVMNFKIFGPSHKLKHLERYSVASWKILCHFNTWEQCKAFHLTTLPSSLRHLLLGLMLAILLRVFSSLQAISFIYRHLYWT